MRLTIPKPFDAHAHLRSGSMLKAVLPYTVQNFGRAIAKAYRDEILAAIPPGAAFTPLMTIYITDQTDPNDLEKG